MAKLSFVVTCMDRLEFLKQTLPTVMAQPDCEYVLVDWSCPAGSGQWAKSVYPRIVLVEVPGQKYFNLPEARNAGYRAATSEKLCFIDADMLMKPGFADVIDEMLKPGTWMQCQNYSCFGFAGAIACYKKDCETIGGFDAKIEGWAPEDVDFKQRLTRHGLEMRWFPAKYIEHIHHSSDIRTKYYEEKNTDLSVARAISIMLKKRRSAAKKVVV